jgi:hypothetical protein
VTLTGMWLLDTTHTQSRAGRTLMPVRIFDNINEARMLSSSDTLGCENALSSPIHWYVGQPAIPLQR